MNDMKTKNESIQYGSKFGRALVYAESVHRMQLRKSTSIPYIGHLLGVASMVIDHGGTEDEAIAALLHDAAEDQGGRRRLNDIAIEFGQGVAAIVEACSDSLDEKPVAKAPYHVRKTTYLEHLKTHANDSTLLVSVCDKTHNLRSMLSDYRAVGEDLWTRFNAGKVGSLQYYRSLTAIFEKSTEPRVSRVAKVLRETLVALEAESQARKDPQLADGRGLIAV